MPEMTVAALRQQVRMALADYMAAEGCSCCRNTDAHQAAAERLAKLLKVPRYADGSGYRFDQFRSTKEPKRCLR